jgi:hypothetical protein
MQFWGFSYPFSLLNIKDMQLSCVFEKKIIMSVSIVLLCKYNALMCSKKLH